MKTIGLEKLISLDCVSVRENVLHAHYAVVTRAKVVSLMHGRVPAVYLGHLCDLAS